MEPGFQLPPPDRGLSRHKHTPNVILYHVCGSNHRDQFAYEI